MKIVNQLIEVIIRKRKPEDVEYSVIAAVVACVANILFYFFIYSVFEDFTQPLLYGVVITVSNILAICVLLKLQGKEGRAVQTITVLFGVSFIFAAVSLGALLTQVLAILAIPLFAYSVYLSVIILKSSFDSPTLIAIVILISTHFFSGTMLTIVCPNYPQEAQNMLEKMTQQLEALEQQS